MAYDASIKKMAIRLSREDHMTTRQIYNHLVDMYGFEGTIRTIQLWLKHASTGEDQDYLLDEQLTDDLEEAVVPSSDPDLEVDDMYSSLVGQIRKLSRSRQNLMDTNRVLRKVFREQDRVITANRALLQHIDREIPRRLSVEPYIPDVIEDQEPKVGIIQMSDWHLNECVLSRDTKGKNTFNFHVAAKRMEKFAHRAIDILTANNIQKVVVAFTGDMYNSTRRIDEVMRQMDVLSVGFMIGVDMVAHFLQHLAKHFEIEVISVFGNESRLDEDVMSVNFANNLDYLMHRVLSIQLRNQQNIIFHNPTLDHELFASINGANILFLHGHNKAKIENIILKYTKMNMVVHYVISGHYHSVSISDISSRSGSGVGDNAYGFGRLSLVSRATQMVYTVTKEEPEWSVITPIPVDIQYADKYKGYPIPTDADRFTMHNTSDLEGKQTILKVVV